MRLGRDGVSEEGGDAYPGWAEAGREPASFWFTTTAKATHKQRPEIAELLRETRLLACQQRFVTKTLCPSVNFKRLQPTHDWSRGATFPGHRPAILREAQAFEAAAASQRAEVERLAAQSAKVAVDTKPSRRRPTYYAGKLAALQKLRTKAAEEADFFDRQALAAKRFTSPEGDIGDATPLHEPSPEDSLDRELAASSAEEESLPNPLPPVSREPAAPRSPGHSPTESGSERDCSRPPLQLDTAAHSPVARSISAPLPAPSPRASLSLQPGHSPNEPGSERVCSRPSPLIDTAAHSPAARSREFIQSPSPSPQQRQPAPRRPPLKAAPARSKGRRK